MRRVLLAALALFASPALAHPAVLSAQPADGASTGPVSQLSITFSEPLVAALSGIDLLMTGMPGMDHHQPMKMTGVKTSLAADGATLVARLPRPLPAGTYEAGWHAASSEAHRTSGKLAFSVK
ncbi:MAG TPA: copper resistance protein CopC [Novosphingobium sp.]|nr:copper resistance protein CopC [Novosphingobium sp.]